MPFPQKSGRKFILQMYTDKLQGKIKILIGVFILSSIWVYGQQKDVKGFVPQTDTPNLNQLLNSQIPPCNLARQTWETFDLYNSFQHYPSRNQQTDWILSKKNNSGISVRNLMLPLPSDYYSRHLGIICQEEWKLEKKTGLPLRFRLGSLQYVDQLEGKIK